MKPVLIASLFGAALLMSGGANASEALAKSNGCLNCHAVDSKKVGPAFKAIAAKYKGQADAESMLVTKLKGGKDHPAVKASDDDLKSLVKWVLAM